MKITKKVWYCSGLWDVVQVFKPTKCDVYVLVQRIRSDQIHKNTKIIPIEMNLIQVGNDDFYPDTKEVAEIFEKMPMRESLSKKNEDKLRDISLELCKSLKN